MSVAGPKRRYTVAWVVWIAAFVVIETLALLNRDEGADTLSEHVWIAVSSPPVWWLTAAFMVWLTIHFLFDGRYDDPRRWFRKDDDNG